jgi:integrase
MRVNLKERTLPSGNVSLYLEISDSGKRRREFLHMLLTGDKLQDRETMKRAEAVRVMKNAELLDRHFGSVTNPIRKSPNFFDYADKLMDSRGHARKVSLRTAVDHFRRFIGTDVTLSNIGRAEIQDFRNYLLHCKGVGPNSANFYLVCIRSIFNQAMKDELLASNPAKGCGVPTQAHLPTFLELADLKKLSVTACRDTHIRNAFLFSCFTGLRYSDVSRLCWTDIQDGSMKIVVKKTRTPIVLPLSRQALDILTEQKGVPRGIVIRNPEGSVFNMPALSSCNKILHAWADKAEIKPISFHVSRHTFAVLSIAAGIDIFTLSKLMTHTNLKTTQRYASVLDSSKKIAVDRLPTL